MNRKSKNLIDISDPRVAQIGHPAPPWLVNYADLMTELCCFFIILFSLTAVIGQKQVKDVQGEMGKVIDEEKLSGDVKQEITEEGLKITFLEKGEKALFESGKAQIRQEAKEVLDKIYGVLAKVENEIVVEGHTDNIPISTTEFKSNWELSTARATSVVRYLIEEKKFPPAHISAIGYGEYRPAVPNDTIEGRSQNRRVVFLVKNLGKTKEQKPIDEWKKEKKGEGE
ncbi:MAG: OmpA family protein [Candidatus Firestonebacteria bacterium]